MSLPPHLRPLISDATEFLRLPGRFELESGDSLDEVTVAWRSWGVPGPRAILICHALTGSADVDSWWPGIIGPHGAFDPEYDYVICANILGSCYGTTGPASLRPDGRQRYRADFPPITIRDMVNVQKSFLDQLGVDRLELVTGPSLGGMQALEWAALYPEQVESIVPIGVGGKHSAWCIAMSTAQRAAIYADPAWQGGYYSDHCTPEQGLAAARMMALCSYRSWHSFDDRFGQEENGEVASRIHSYLHYQGEKINRRFDANTYVRLTQAMNRHDVARGRGVYLEVLESIRQPALLVSVSSDLLYPPHEQELLARHLPNADYRLLQSDFGHDGFLVGTEALAGLIAGFRNSLAAMQPRRAVS